MFLDRLFLSVQSVRINVTNKGEKGREDSPRPLFPCPCKHRHTGYDFQLIMNQFGTKKISFDLAHELVPNKGSHKHCLTTSRCRLITDIGPSDDDHTSTTCFWDTVISVASSLLITPSTTLGVHHLANGKIVHYFTHQACPRGISEHNRCSETLKKNTVGVPSVLQETTLPELGSHRCPKRL